MHRLSTIRVLRRSFNARLLSDTADVTENVAKSHLGVSNALTDLMKQFPSKQAASSEKPEPSQPTSWDSFSSQSTDSRDRRRDDDSTSSSSSSFTTSRVGASKSSAASGASETRAPFSDDSIHTKWAQQYMNFESKWRGRNLDAAKHRSSNVDDLKDLESVLQMKWDWKKESGALDRVETPSATTPYDRSDFSEPSTSSINTDNHVDSGRESVDLDEDLDDIGEQRAFEEWKGKQLQMVTLTNEERFQYAQMVKHLEDEYEMQWGDILRKSRWDKKWPRRIQRDGSAEPEKDQDGTYAELESRQHTFERRKSEEVARNRALAAILDKREQALVDAVLQIRIGLKRVGVDDDSLQNFRPRTSASHGFLTDTGGDSPAQAEKAETRFYGDASRLVDGCREFLRLAKERLASLPEEAHAEHSDLLDDLEDRVEDSLELIQGVEHALAEHELDVDEPEVPDLRFLGETDPHNALRPWETILQRQQRMFDEANKDKVHKYIAEHQRGVQLEQDADRVVVDPDRPRTGIPSVDQHYDELVDIVNRSGYMNRQQRMEMMRNIPADLGGVGDPLPRFTKLREGETFEEDDGSAAPPTDKGADMQKKKKKKRGR